MRAHDSCFHEWKVLLVFWRSGALVQWSTGNAWLHPVSACGPVNTCSEITEWTGPEEEQQEIYHRNRGKSRLIDDHVDPRYWRSDIDASKYSFWIIILLHNYIHEAIFPIIFFAWILNKEFIFWINKYFLQ